MALTTRKKPSGVHHRKRQGQHHRKSKHYLRAYSPYIPMLLIVAVGFVVNSVWSHSGVLGTQQDFSTTSFLQDTNTQRAAYGEPALLLNPQLAAAAQAKATDMAQLDYWAHISPQGQTPWATITASGYQYQAAGENLAYGFDNAASAVAAWMSSPEHRANILTASYQHVGFGVAQTANYQGHGPTTIVVAEYGQPITTVFAGGNNPLNQAALAARPVSRVQLLVNDQAAWSVAAIVAIAGGGFAFLLVRHSLRLHKVLVRGEAFVTRHPFLDVAITLIVTAGVLLTRSSGTIR